MPLPVRAEFILTQKTENIQIWTDSKVRTAIVTRQDQPLNADKWRPPQVSDLQLLLQTRQNLMREIGYEKWEVEQKAMSSPSAKVIDISVEGRMKHASRPTISWFLEHTRLTPLQSTTFLLTIEDPQSVSTSDKQRLKIHFAQLMKQPKSQERWRRFLRKPAQKRSRR